MKEFELIEYIGKKFKYQNANRSLILPIGDDCSIIRPPEGKLQVTTTDSLVDGNHFSSRYFKPQEIGRKVLRVNLSDLASMGAEGPYYAWLIFALPPNIKDDLLKGILEGMRQDCKRYNVILAGGNITSWAGFSIHLTLCGWVTDRNILTRRGARVDDSIFVTGTIGAPTLAYRQFKKGRKPHNFLLKRWANPDPKLKTGILLAKHQIASSCIDISDGIFQDMGHITKTSRVGAHIEWERLPIEPKLRKMNPTPQMIGYGEDYELLFTVPQRNLKKLKMVSGKITEIGKIVRKGFKVVDGHGREIEVEEVGYNHFK